MERKVTPEKDILPLLIHARTALESQRPEEALKAIRSAIKSIGPDRSLEMAMREGATAQPTPAVME